MAQAFFTLTGETPPMLLFVIATVGHDRLWRAKPGARTVHNMRLFVMAKPGAMEERVEQIDPTHFVVSVRERAEKGKANAAIRKVLARHLRISPSELTLRSGAASRRKVFEKVARPL